jgi:hypothetical protein
MDIPRRSWFALALLPFTALAAKLRDPLRGIAGEAVPRLLGVEVGELEADRAPVGCDTGSGVPADWIDLPQGRGEQHGATDQVGRGERHGRTARAGERGGFASAGGEGAEDEETHKDAQN